MEFTASMIAAALPYAGELRTCAIIAASVGVALLFYGRIAIGPTLICAGMGLLALLSYNLDGARLERALCKLKAPTSKELQAGLKLTAPASISISGMGTVIAAGRQAIRDAEADQTRVANREQLDKLLAGCPEEKE